MSKAVVLLVTGLLVSGLVNMAAGQTTDPHVASGVIAGRVIEPRSGAPVAAASVTLVNRERTATTLADPPLRETNERGEFTFTGLSAGSYELTAEKNGYLAATYGQIRPGSASPGVSIRLATDQRLSNLALVLPRASVITGLAMDQRGEPALAIIRLWRYDWIAGERVLRTGIDRVTDDRGSYRFWGLRPGEYLVSAEPISSSGNPINPPPAPIFYPGTPVAADAIPVIVGIGEERPGIDMSVRTVLLGSISGTIVGRSNSPAESVRLAITDSSGAAPLRPQYALQKTGAFTISNLAPGQYRIMAMAMMDGIPKSWAMADVSLAGGNVSAGILTLQPGGTISGHITFDATPPRNLADSYVSLRSLDAGRRALVVSPSARVAADGSFAIEGIMPGRYALVAGRLPDGTIVKSMKHNDRDVYDLPIELRPSEDMRDVDIRLTGRRASVTGSLLDASGQATSDYLVILFAADERYWLFGSPRIRTVRPASDGQYSFRDVPPGAYRLAALTDAEPDEWFATTFLKRIIAQSSALTLAEGEAKAMTLRLR
jgi:uncharacterized protein (DUF2141 family)